MTKPNVNDYDLKAYGYIYDLQLYCEYLEKEIEKLKTK